MRAWRAHQLGDPYDVLRLDEVDEPVAGPGELVVDIEATGLAYPEVLMCQGKYQGRHADSLYARR
jgi:NADPH2:quinone reductase